jgi:hypothetical protein
MKISTTLMMASSIALLACTHSIDAQTAMWLGGDGNWTDANSWENAQLPAAGDGVDIAIAGEVYYDDTNNHGYSSLLVDGGCILNDNGGRDLTIVGNARFGASGSGRLYQNGATINIGADLMLGENVGSDGNYSLAGMYNADPSVPVTPGILNVSVNEIIGVSGTGSFTQANDTTHTIGSISFKPNDENPNYPAERRIDSASGALLVGCAEGSAGSYTLDNGSLTVFTDQFVGQYGSGSFVQNAGTNNIGALNTYHDANDNLCTELRGGLWVGYGATADGHYALNGGSLTVESYEFIGNSGTGELIQSAGSHTVGWDLAVGSGAGSNGAFSLLGGDLAVGKVTTKNNDENPAYPSEQLIDSVCGNLAVGADSGSIGTFQLTAGNLTVGCAEIIGNNGTGTLTQNGGTNTMGASFQYHGAGDFSEGGGLSRNYTGGLWIGMGPTGDGLYTLNDGTLTVNAPVTIGDLGKGKFVQNGGMFDSKAMDMTIGNGVGSAGTYEMSAGTLNAGDIYIGGGLYGGVGGGISGGDGVGTFIQTGGNVNVVTADDTIRIARQSLSIGAYELSGGNLTSSGLDVGLYGSGTFTQSGGKADLSYVRAGLYDTSDGTINLNGGELNIAQSLIVGEYSSGAVSQTAGMNTIGYQLSLGSQSGSVGTYDLTGGDLITRSDEIVGDAGTGAFHLAGGTNDAWAIIVGNRDGSRGSYVQDGGSTSAKLIHVAELEGSSGEYNLSGGDLTSGGVWLGMGGEGTMTQEAGTTHTLAANGAAYGTLIIGGWDSPSGKGTYNMNGGQLTAEQITVGYKGIGTFNQNGGINQTTNGFFVGGSTGQGFYNLNAGELNSAKCEFVGLQGAGTFTQNGGANHISGGYQIWQAPWDPAWKQYAGLNLGRNVGSSGTYNLLGGNLTVLNASIIGDRGYGEFNLGYGDKDSGKYVGDGIHTTGDLYVGYRTQSSAPSSVYNLFSGTLNVVGGSGLMGFTIIGGKDYGPVGTGVFNQFGGVHNTSGLFLADTPGSSAAYNLSGGTLNISGWGASIGGAGAGVFNQSGGTHVIAEDLYIANQPGSNGTYNLSGGTLEVSTVGSLNTGITNNDTFNYSGGELIIHKGVFTNSGTFNLSGGGTRTVNGNVVNGINGTMNVTNTEAVFAGTFINRGAYISDPSSNYFTDLVVEQEGYLVGGAGDSFNFRGGLSSQSTNSSWNTVGATIAFIGPGSHTLSLDHANPNSFHWGTLLLDPGAGVDFVGGTGDLYVDSIVVPDLDQLSDISPNLNVHFLAIFRQTPGGMEPYDLTGVTLPSNVKAIPEPASILIFCIGGAALVARRRTRTQQG